MNLPKPDRTASPPSFSLHITPPHSPTEKPAPKKEVNHISRLM